MEPIPNYDLLQAIDPTKIKVPISERFAKLTLSSNKKQQEKCLEPDQQQEELKIQQDKRNSVTRNISKQFGDEAKDNEEQNPLLRSESSKDTEGNNSANAKDAAADLSMEPLEVSQDLDNPTQLSHDDLDLLSQQIASMAVEEDPKVSSLPSTGSTGNLSLLTELFSCDSQPSSSCNEDNNVRIVRHIPINVREAVKRNTILLNLTTSSKNENVDKTFEITEDEDEEYSDEIEVITISDTSLSHHEEADNVMATSSLPCASLASESQLNIPSITDDKAERVAAFLRDVSTEQRALREQGQVVFRDSIDSILDNQEIDEIQEALTKAKQIATADTESMTPDVDEEVTPRSQLKREKRLQDLEEFKGKETTSVELQKIQNSTNAHRLANDETQDNTIITEAEDQNEIEITPKYVAKLKTPLRDISPTTPKSSRKNVYRISKGQHTSETKDSPKNLTENSRRLANLETENNTESSFGENNFLSPNKNKQNDSRRLLNEDTVHNSIADIDVALTQQSGSYNYSQDYKTPAKVATSNESENKLTMSYQSSPQNSENSRQSLGSILCSSSEFNESVPEHSITILETDEENLKEKNSPTPSENPDDKKLSNSFHKEDSSADSDDNDLMSQIRLSMAQISISAKINIKIHIPNITSTETESEDDKVYKRDAKRQEMKTKQKKQTKETEKEAARDNGHSIESSDKASGESELEHAEKICNQRQLQSPVEEVSNSNKSPNSIDIVENKTVDNDRSTIASKGQNMESKQPEEAFNELQLKSPVAAMSTSSNKSSDSEEIVEDKKFLTEAEKLLNQLYGKSWQTPEVIRTLKRCSKSTDKKTSNSKSISIKKNDNVKKSSMEKTAVEESILDDFSIFHRNIVKTNLNSTRLGSPKTVMQQNKEILTEPRHTKKSATHKRKMDVKNMPQTERKPVNSTAVAEENVRNRRRVVNAQRWQHLIDSDSNSEGDNASDDENADETWSRNASELECSDSDFENSPMPKAGKRTKRVGGHSAKSDYLTKVLNKSKADEIVYLDLSKEEVEVQDEVPESPPANHDATFASHLQNILRTCSREERPKLPSSKNKTKRKLFTPNFGDEDFAAALSKEDEIKDKDKTTANINNRNSDEEILEDTGFLPFDSKGRPKILSVVNKPLEAVKTGKPIFLLPSPTKKRDATTSSSNKMNITSECENIPKTKPVKEAIFKTPLTANSKGTTKASKEQWQSSYKYSFLKSLDVEVSKTLCHPDALYYRNNYRTKKEELTKILYDMYNEKVFNNKLNVPITWNKKLLNTAGRCCNKKKLGIRLSAVELSDKVLTSADRLRCTLIHELCHAATWVFSGEGGHGSTWKQWAHKANYAFPEIPKIGRCHQYDIEYKYTYKCTLCGAKSHSHSKSKKVENIRCSYCHGAIEIFLNKKDKDGNVVPTPAREATGFAKFVKDNYKKFKRDDLKHADVMKLLSSEFAELKVATN